MTTAVNSTAKPGKSNTHTVEVVINSSHVEVPSPKSTGVEIKQAAIHAGLPVQLDFVLSEERHNGDTKIVSNEDTLTVNKNSQFVLVPPDDNS